MNCHKHKLETVLTLLLILPGCLLTFGQSPPPDSPFWGGADDGYHIGSSLPGGFCLMYTGGPGAGYSRLGPDANNCWMYFANNGLPTADDGYASEGPDASNCYMYFANNGISYIDDGYASTQGGYIPELVEDTLRITILTNQSEKTCFEMVFPGHTDSIAWETLVWNTPLADALADNIDKICIVYMSPVAGKDTLTVSICDECAVCVRGTLIVTVLDPPSWELTKTVVETSYDGTDDVLHYTLNLDNTSGYDISSVSLTDPSVTDLVRTGGDNGDNILQPDETWTYTATHSITQADLDAGHYKNVATAAGTATYTLEPARDSVDVPANQNADWTLSKAVDETVYCAAGDGLHYTLTLRNIGNVSIHDVIAADPGSETPGPVYASGDDGDQILEPRETWTYTATHTITGADVTAGFYTNAAAADGKLPSGGNAPHLTAQVRVNGQPGPGEITGPISVCEGDTGIGFSIAAVTGATGYEWTVPPGWEILTQNANAITAKASGYTGSVCVTLLTESCTFAQECTTVTVVVVPGKPVFNPGN